MSSGGILYVDPDNEYIKVGDNVDLIFGDGATRLDESVGDAKIRWDGTDLDLLPTVDDSIFKIGDGTLSFDLWLMGASAAGYVSWDASANDLKFEDSCSLMFGTGAGAGPGNAGDVELRWDGTDLDVLAAADDSVLKVGNGTNSFDLWVYGNTASDYVLWDASANELSLQGAGTLDVPDGQLQLSNTAIVATALELNRAADVSTRLIAAGSTLGATVAAHSDKIIALDTASGSVVTLPAATGTGAVIRAIVTVKPTSNAHIIKVTGDDTLKGSANLLDEDGTPQTAYSATGTDDTLTWNGTTTGGQVGDWVELVDVLTDVWAIRAQAVCIAGSNIADCFSATVA